MGKKKGVGKATTIYDMVWDWIVDGCRDRDPPIWNVNRKPKNEFFYVMIDDRGEELHIWAVVEDDRGGEVTLAEFAWVIDQDGEEDKTTEEFFARLECALVGAEAEAEILADKVRTKRRHK